MDIFLELKKNMNAYSKIEEKKIITVTVSSNGISKIKLRDYLMEIGTILEFDEKAGIYVATIKAGIGNKNSAIIGIMMKDKILYIASYAKEGLINQKTSEKAIEKVLSVVN